jgi:hypothetical protein
LQRELTRADIGALLVETRNRLDALRSGRADRPRIKGPASTPRASRTPRSSASSSSIRTSTPSTACATSACGR